jgi:CRISPR-associated endonuclease/helicase Cas3
MDAFEFINLDRIIENIRSIHAHTDSNKDSETLEEHLLETKKFLIMLFEQKGIGEIISKIINELSCNGEKLSDEYKSLIRKMFINAVFLHDVGKINPAFQKIKMKNMLFQDVSFNDSEHSLISALIFIDIFEPFIKEISSKAMKYYMYYFLFSFAYEISRHHSYLKDTLDLTDKLMQKQDSKYYKNYKSSGILNIKLEENCAFTTIHRRGYYKNWKMDGLDFYILNRFLFALITACDFYATYSFKTGNKIDFGVITDIESILSYYKNYEVYKGIEAYRIDKNVFYNMPINSLRSDLFIEAEKNLLENLENNLYYLEAPTGGGKTNISINLALQIVKNKPNHNKIFYIFPFNTLVEQTKTTFEEIFGKMNNFAVINSITPIITKEEVKLAEGDNKIDYNRSYLDRQFLHYPIILTTHINFFSYLFGTGRESSFPLVHLCNSVIILDEIQSYRNKIWTEIIMFLSKY